MDYRLDILKSFEEVQKQRPSTWRKVWLTTIIVVPVMFAAFSVYKFCTYGVIEEIRSPTEKSNELSAEIDQKHEISTEKKQDHDISTGITQNNDNPTVQIHSTEVATLEFKPKPIPDETLETLRNLNVLIKDLSEHNEALRAERDLLKAKIEDSTVHSDASQALIVELKSQNEKFRAEVEQVRGQRSGLEAQRDKMKRQRDEVSGVLNEMMRTYGQANCDFLRWKEKAGQEVWLWVTERGGYCLRDKPPHYWDNGLTEALSKFLANKTVVSFGEGPAYYHQEVMAVGEVLNYTSYDGSPFYEIDGDEKVKFLDISVPQYGLPQFDWVVCIEVGQHVPRRFEKVVVENLARHAKEGVILSWSAHGQGGYSQPNPRSGGFLIELFDELDFKQHSAESKVLREASKAGWLKRNIQVYRRKDPDSYDPNSN